MRRACMLLTLLSLIANPLSAQKPVTYRMVMSRPSLRVANTKHTGMDIATVSEVTSWLTISSRDIAGGTLWIITRDSTQTANSVVDAKAFARMSSYTLRPTTKSKDPMVHEVLVREGHLLAATRVRDTLRTALVIDSLNGFERMMSSQTIIALPLASALFPAAASKSRKARFTREGIDSSFRGGATSLPPGTTLSQLKAMSTLSELRAFDTTFVEWKRKGTSEVQGEVLTRSTSYDTYGPGISGASGKFVIRLAPDGLVREATYITKSLPQKDARSGRVSASTSDATWTLTRMDQ